MVEMGSKWPAGPRGSGMAADGYQQYPPVSSDGGSCVVALPRDVEAPNHSPSRSKRPNQRRVDSGR